MLKKTIKWEDLDGNPVEEDYYFHMSKAELIELEVSEEGGWAEAVQRIAKEEDIKKIVEIFKKLILQAYGVKSPDGKRFIKSEELSREFSQTEAYSTLFMEFLTDENAGAAFVNAIVPQDLAQQVALESAAIAEKEAAVEELDTLQAAAPATSLTPEENAEFEAWKANRGV